MKTKTLVSAMALPLLLAACSQDEFVSQSNNQSLDGRKVVENVTINLEVPATRLTIDGVDYKWEAGDQFGACLMDEFSEKPSAVYPGAEWWGQFTLKDYIQTNYPFTRGEGENAGWTSEAVMQEGNYFFYAPYNSNLGGKRTPIRLEVPTEQTIDPSKPYDVLSKQLFVAYAPVHADADKDHETVDITMEPLLAFPGFNLKNVGTGSLTIKRIAFVDENGFSKVMEVKPATGSFDGSAFIAPNSTANSRRTALKSIVKPDETEKAEKITLDFGENGYVLGSQKDVNALMLIPEGGFTSPKLYIYSDAGLAIADLSDAHKDGGKEDGVTNITNDRKLTSVTYNDGAFVKITFDNTSFAQPSEMIVSTTEDLEDLVNWSKDNTDADAEMTAKVQGDNVVISKNLCDMLNANKKLNLVVTSNNENAPVTVTIPAEASADVLDRITFNNVKVVNKAELTVAENFGYNNDGKTGVVELTNNENASVTLTGASYSLNNTKVINNGKLTLAKATGTMAIEAGEGANNAITNNGVMNVAGNVSVTAGGIANLGTLTVNDKATLTARITNGAEGTQKGVINVNGTWVVKFQAGANYGLINVASAGAIDATQAETKLENKGNDIYYQNSLVYRGRIENNGNIKGITNNGTIVMKSKTASVQSADGSEGKIDNTVLSPYVLKVENETVYAEVSGEKKASEIATIVSGSNATELYLSGTITIDPAEKETQVSILGEQTTLKVIANGDLTFKPTKTGDKVWFDNSGRTGATFNVEKGTTIVEQGAVVSFGKGLDNQVSVSNGALLKIQAGAEFICGIDKPSGVDNFGTWTKNNGN